MQQHSDDVKNVGSKDLRAFANIDDPNIPVFYVDEMNVYANPATVTLVMGTLEAGSIRATVKIKMSPEFYKNFVRAHINLIEHIGVKPMDGTK